MFSRCSQDVLRMFSLYQEYSGGLVEPGASGGSCGSCVSFGYYGPGRHDESAWFGGSSWSGWSNFGYSWMFSGYLIGSKSVLKWKSGL